MLVFKFAKCTKIRITGQDLRFSDLVSLATHHQQDAPLVVTPTERPLKAGLSGLGRHTQKPLGHWGGAFP